VTREKEGGSLNEGTKFQKRRGSIKDEGSSLGSFRFSRTVDGEMKARVGHTRPGAWGGGSGQRKLNG